MNWDELLDALSEKTNIGKSEIDQKLRYEFRQLKTPVDEREWSISDYGENSWLIKSQSSKRVIFVGGFDRIDPKTDEPTEVRNLEVRYPKREQNVFPPVGLGHLDKRVHALPHSAPDRHRGR